MNLWKKITIDFYATLAWHFPSEIVGAINPEFVDKVSEFLNIRADVCLPEEYIKDVQRKRGVYLKEVSGNYEFPNNMSREELIGLINSKFSKYFTAVGYKKDGYNNGWARQKRHCDKLLQELPLVEKELDSLIKTVINDNKELSRFSGAELSFSNKYHLILGVANNFNADDLEWFIIKNKNFEKSFEVAGYKELRDGAVNKYGVNLKWVCAPDTLQYIDSKVAEKETPAPKAIENTDASKSFARSGGSAVGYLKMRKDGSLPEPTSFLKR